MELQEILYSQGFGTRRVCAGLVQQGWVSVLPKGESTAQKCLDATQKFDPDGLQFEVQGQLWPYQRQAYIMLNKPVGVECSQKPSLEPVKNFVCEAYHVTKEHRNANQTTQTQSGTGAVRHSQRSH
jgi:16S rRNA U516 pseudouridylate synthase RsuA-like enzyme